MVTEEKREEIRANAMKLVQMDGVQLLIVQAFQNGMAAGQQLERRNKNKCREGGEEWKNQQ